MQYRTTARAICWIIIVCGAAMACAFPFYFESPSMYYKLGWAKTFLRSGKVTGILAGGLIMIQAVTAARPGWLEKIFGLDRLWQFHRGNGIVLTLIALCHPILVLWADDFSFFPMEKRYWPEFTGIGLLILLAGVTLTALYRKRFCLGWQTWFMGHRITTILVIGITFIHVRFVSKPFESGIPFYLLIIVFLAAVFFWAFKQALNAGFFSSKWSVRKIEPIARDACAVTVQKNNRQPFSHLPGQFVFFTPVGSELAAQSHPFTISSWHPDPDKLRFIIRAAGDFTRQIPGLAPGDTVRLDGPYGCFSHVLRAPAPLVMIAGGIGITPMLSMIEYMADRKDDRPVVLIWSSRTKDHLFYLQQLAEISAAWPAFEFYPLLTREISGETLYQRLDEASLKHLLQSWPRQTDIFICGPPGLARGLKQPLKALGFSTARVYTESFVL